MQKNWFQNDLAKAVSASHDIIGRYERNEAVPSIEMTLKMAKAFDVSLDFLAGEGQNATFDKQTLRLLQHIEGLEPTVREKIFFLPNAVIRDAKTKQAYAS